MLHETWAEHPKHMRWTNRSNNECPPPLEAPLVSFAFRDCWKGDNSHRVLDRSFLRYLVYLRHSWRGFFQRRVCAVSSRIGRELSTTSCHQARREAHASAPQL